MKPITCLSRALFLVGMTTLFSACVTGRNSGSDGESASMFGTDYASRIPQTIGTSEKTIVVDPRVHVWGAYENGQLVNAGIASAGSNWCGDIGRPCRTHVGTFRIQSLGGPDCHSHIFPVGIGGAPMPYCMYFNNGQALHGVPASEVGEGNYSHGCVRMHVSDAEWIRFDFANVGTKVIIKPYD
jgi:lipoprotein-anchoring transpeptidase ErfK/SrfK